MKTRHEWYGFIGWLLAASIVALQARFVHAAEGPPGPSINLKRGESYVIKGVRTDSAPEVKSIDNPHALIVNKQPDGNVLVLGADAGVETVKVTMADGSSETYTVTVNSDLDRANPLTPGPAPAVIGDSGAAGGGAVGGPSASPDSSAGYPMDSGAGPADSSARPETRPGAPPAASGDTSAVTPTQPPAVGSPNSATAPAGSEPGPESNNAAPSKPIEQPAEVAAPTAPTFASAWTAPQSGQVSPSQTASLRAETISTDPMSSEPSDAAVKGTHFLPDDGIAMMFGTSKVFDFPQRIKRVSIADSEVADLQVINPHQVMLIGHKPGFTTLAVWDNQGHYEERQVRIEQTGHQQVLLNCTVAEVNRTRLENQGINLAGAIPHSGLSAVGLSGSVATPYSGSSNLSSSASNGSSNGGILPLGGQLIPLLLSSNLTYGVSYDYGNAVANGFFQFLENHQLARILAEPHLLANSGQEAKFLEGGEIPIVLAQALNTSVVFKQFGTSVVFIPTVVGKRDIELVVKPEVSKPDFSQGVQLFGFTVPAFITRRAETVVRMKDNQTLIIAGLILHDKTQIVNKVPYLGDMPYMGALFRTTSYQDTKTELVMSVTPQIVGALGSGAQIQYPSRALTQDEIKTRSLAEPDVSRPRF